MVSNNQAPIQSGFNSKSTSSDVLEGTNLKGKLAIVTGGIQVLVLKLLKV